MNCKHEIEQCDSCGNMKCKKCGKEFVDKSTIQPQQYQPVWIYPYWQYQDWKLPTITVGTETSTGTVTTSGMIYSETDGNGIHYWIKS